MTAKSAARFEQLKAILDSQTVWGRPCIREWRKGELARLYYSDNSFLYVDAGGSVRSSGGAATRAKIEHGLI
jgi:hypothetical protein